MIKRYVEKYDFSKVKFTDTSCFDYSEDGFVLKIRLKRLTRRESIIFESSGCVRVIQKLLRPEDKENLTDYERSEYYFQHTDENDCAPVIEVKINLFSEDHPDWTDMKLGINLLAYDIINKDLFVVYDKVNFRLVYDGKVINNNMPFGELKRPENTVFVCESDAIVEYSNNIYAARYYRENEQLNKNLNYYTPYGHNSFIGDVVNFYHGGVYHLLYMPDRHHHGNRWGGGGHHFEHMITKDFVNWEDVGPIWDIS